MVAVDARDLNRLHQWGFHRTGHHHGDPDAVARQVEAQHLGKAAQTVLACAVGGVPRQCDQPGSRGHVDQMAAAARLDHRRHERLDDVDRAHQVDVDHRLPVLMGEPVDRAPRRDARDVHHHVHGGVAGMDVGGEAGHLVVVGDVESAVLGHLRAQRAGVGDRRRQSLCVAVGEVQLGALRRPASARSRGRCRWRRPVRKQRLPSKPSSAPLR